MPCTPFCKRLFRKSHLTINPVLTKKVKFRYLHDYIFNFRMSHWIPWPPQNMDLDTKTNVIRQLEAELWKLTRFSVAILNFEFFGWNCWSGIVVPAIFGISIPPPPPPHPGPIFMLSSQSARPFHISALLYRGLNIEVY